MLIILLQTFSTSVFIFMRGIENVSSVPEYKNIRVSLFYVAFVLRKKKIIKKKQNKFNSKESFIKHVTTYFASHKNIDIYQEPLNKSNTTTNIVTSTYKEKDKVSSQISAPVQTL